MANPGALAASLFVHTHPKIGFTPAEKRLLRAALTGLTHVELAKALKRVTANGEEPVAHDLRSTCPPRTRNTSGGPITTAAGNVTRSRETAPYPRLPPPSPRGAAPWPPLTR